METRDEFIVACVRRFWKMLIGIMAAFLLAEIAGSFGWVPALKSVSLQEVTSNILFAIGFGCPVVLYLSRLPRVKELFQTAAVGTVLFAIWFFLQWKAYAALPATTQSSWVASKGIIAAGVASLTVLGLRVARTQGPERLGELSWLLPACVALVYTLLAGVFLDYIRRLFPVSYDAYAFTMDQAFGGQWSFTLGRWFAAWPVLKWICFAIYVAPPPALVFVYALERQARKPPPVDCITALLALAVGGYLCYFLFPVYGPRFAFPGTFPAFPHTVHTFIHERIRILNLDGWPNGVPSLHVGSVILAFWHARPYGRVARTIAGIFVVGTCLATLGLGEHYVVDLVMGLVFCLVVHAACVPARDPYRGKRLRALVTGIVLVGLWYIALFNVEILVPKESWLMAVFAVLTVGITLGVERSFYRAAWCA